jgi:adenylyl-sulfate kinase
MKTEGFTIWFTGLPCSGKSTVAKIVEKYLRDLDMNVEVLDGDIVRQHLTQGLGFSKEGRDLNIKRIGFVCKLLSRNGVAAIAAAISPYREIRDWVRKEIGRFVEVYASCPLEECIKRDVKGMYKKAIAGELKNFTGVDDPYEPPSNPEVIIYTDREIPQESADKIIRNLEELNYIPGKFPKQSAASCGGCSGGDDGYTAEEREKIDKRLKGLGYM